MISSGRRRGKDRSGHRQHLSCYFRRLFAKRQLQLLLQHLSIQQGNQMLHLTRNNPAQLFFPKKRLH